MPKIKTDNTINSFFKTAISILVISNHDSFRVLFDKIASVYILFEKYIYILTLEMASPGNQHCAGCIDTLSFPISCHVEQKLVLETSGFVHGSAM